MFDAEIEAANIACACADRLYNVSMVHLCTCTMCMYNVHICFKSQYYNPTRVSEA